VTFSTFRLKSALGAISVALFLTLTAAAAGAQMLTAFGFGTDLQTEGSEPDLVASGLAVGNMTLTWDGVARRPPTYGEGSAGRGAVTEGGWSPQAEDNFFETVITAIDPGTSFRITDIDFDFKIEASNGHRLTISMIPNGEEAVTVYSLAGGGFPEWRPIDFCLGCFSTLGWAAILARTDLQSLVIQIQFDPVSTEATFGIDELILWGEMLAASGVDDQPGVRSTWVLGQNHPNPFNPRTSISYGLERAGAVSLRVYDLRGQEVRRLVDGFREAGTYVATWDGRDAAGRRSGSGVYVYRLRTQDGVEVRRMTLLQ